MPRLMTCDECGKQTERLYVVRTQVVCRRCFLAHRKALVQPTRKMRADG